MSKKENVWYKIKRWIINHFSSSPKALEAPTAKESKTNVREQCKVTSIDDMEIEQLNQLIKDRDSQIEDEVILSQILKRMGTNQELTKKIVDNSRAKCIFSYHIKNGNLIQQPTGEVIFEDMYTHTAVGDTFSKNERTTIARQENAIVIKNTEEYGYYSDCNDGRPVRQVKITENKWKGITLENIEVDKIEGQMLKSAIAYDNHGIEMEKKKEIYHSAKGEKEEIKVERLEGKPFAVKEIWCPKPEKGQTIFYGMVDEKRPDILYSYYFTARKENFATLAELEERYHDTQYRNSFVGLDNINPKAARYFREIEENER